MSSQFQQASTPRKSWSRNFRPSPNPFSKTTTIVYFINCSKRWESAPQTTVPPVGSSFPISSSPPCAIFVRVGGVRTAYAIARGCSLWIRTLTDPDFLSAANAIINFWFFSSITLFPSYLAICGEQDSFRRGNNGGDKRTGRNRVTGGSSAGKNRWNAGLAPTKDRHKTVDIEKRADRPG